MRFNLLLDFVFIDLFLANELSSVGREGELKRKEGGPPEDTKKELVIKSAELMLEPLLEDGVPGATWTPTALENWGPWVFHGYSSFIEDSKVEALRIPSGVADLGSVPMLQIWRAS